MKKVVFVVFVLVLTYGFNIAKAGSGCEKKNSITIVYPCGGSEQELLAAKEIRRYMYLRTGKMLSLVENDGELPDEGDLVVVGTKGDKLIKKIAAKDGKLKSQIKSLHAQQYRIKTIEQSGRKVVVIAGGDSIGTLYGAYRFCEHLGVRFFLHGDAVPDDKICAKLPDVDDTGKPLFDLRGLNPWGSHVEGMDLWNADDYKSVFSQMTKMRMNFMGIHGYPETDLWWFPHAEPLVWMGLKSDFDERGNVKYSYPSTYANALRTGYWGYKAKKTSDFNFGAAELFEDDVWSPDVMKGYCPWPKTEQGYNEVFNRMGSMLNDSFSFARSLGVKTCIGTETPITIPGRVRTKFEKMGRDPNDIEVVREVYEAMFQRIMKTHPIDYYWLWTAEAWTWGANTEGQADEVINDIKTAHKALKNVKAPFKLATAGWVLGPKGDRAGFDRMLPKDIATSAISRQFGGTEVDVAFGQVKGRQKWAIPWLEGDPELTSPQLWVGRMRKDAADALMYGCNGLMGLQWRTRIVGPNASALAQAAWDQSGWNKQKEKTIIRYGGYSYTNLAQEIEGTEEDEIYQSCHYDMDSYDFKVPNGSYKVTLKFSEPYYKEAGKRVFDVLIQDSKVIEELDIFAKSGRFGVTDYTFDKVAVTNGLLQLKFEVVESLPCISAIIVEGGGFVKKLNCGGDEYKDYVSDKANRYLSSASFYEDWAPVMFGENAGKQAAKIFEKIDCKHPLTSTWGYGGAGAVTPDKRQWSKVKEGFVFIDELAQLRPKVKGQGNLERFDYWLNSFRYSYYQAAVRCLLAEFNKEIEEVEAIENPAKRKRTAKGKALKIYKEMIENVKQAYYYQFARVSTVGGIATIINWEGHSGPRILDENKERLTKALGGKLPSDIQFPKQYHGPARIIVPTVRTNLDVGESLKLKVIILGIEPSQANLYIRRMGGSDNFTKVALDHIARSVYTVTIPALGDDIEYYIKAVGCGKELLWPATTPNMNQTVVVK